jgi:hypothetical protein
VTSIAIVLVRRKRARDAAKEDEREPSEVPLVEAVRRADAERRDVPKLIMVEEGAAHVVYVVEGRVPKIEHDGKVHTLH